MTDDFSAPEYRRRRQASLAISVGAAIVAVGTSAWLWNDVRTIDTRESSVEQQLNSVSRHGEALAAQDQAFSQALGDLNAGHEDVSQRLDNLYGARRSGLLAAEAEHLVRLAAQRLALMQDPAGALALLNAADGALKEVHDADVNAARAALAADTVALRAASQLDVEGVYLRLAALPATVDAIAGRAAGEKPAKTTVPKRPVAAPPATGSWWQRLQDALASLVTIRRVDAPLTPMITAGERALAAQNFQLLVEQAQLALLQRRGSIYQHSLAQADAWLARISAGEPASRNAVHRELASLQTLDLGGNLPDLTASIAATRTLAARLLPESAAPAPIRKQQGPAQ